MVWTVWPQRDIWLCRATVLAVAKKGRFKTSMVRMADLTSCPAKSSDGRYEQRRELINSHLPKVRSNSIAGSLDLA